MEIESDDIQKNYWIFVEKQQKEIECPKVIDMHNNLCYKKIGIDIPK